MQINPHFIIYIFHPIFLKMSFLRLVRFCSTGVSVFSSLRPSFNHMAWVKPYFSRSFIAKTTDFLKVVFNMLPQINKTSHLIIMRSGFAGCSRGALSSTQSSLPDRLHRVYHWLPGQGHLWWSHNTHQASLDLQRWVYNFIVLGFPSKFVLAQNHRPQSVSHHYYFIWAVFMLPEA